MTKKPHTRGEGPRRRFRPLIPWAAGAGALLVAIGVSRLEPDRPPPSPAPNPPAPPALPAPPAPEPATATFQPAEPAQPTAVAAEVPAVPAPGEADEEQTLYLTIVGDQVYRVMGPVSGRPPRIDQLPGLVSGQRPAGPVAGAGVPVRPGAGFVIADFEQPAPPLAEGERPLGPAPQECPRTLPPGTDQATVDGLRSQSGCRYLSSCAAGTNQCTFYYQGRG